MKENGETDDNSPTINGSGTSLSSDKEENSVTKLKTQSDKQSPVELLRADEMTTHKKKRKSKTKTTKENENIELETQKPENESKNRYKRKTRTRN